MEEEVIGDVWRAAKGFNGAELEVKGLIGVADRLGILTVALLLVILVEEEVAREPKSPDESFPNATAGFNEAMCEAYKEAACSSVYIGTRMF